MCPPHSPSSPCKWLIQTMYFGSVICQITCMVYRCHFLVHLPGCHSTACLCHHSSLAHKYTGKYLFQINKTLAGTWRPAVQEPRGPPVSYQSLDRGLITAYVGGSCLGLPVGHSGLPWPSGCGPDILPGYSLPLAHELNHETPHLLVPPAEALTGATCWEGPSASALHQWRLITTSTRLCPGFPGLLNLAHYKSRMGGTSSFIPAAPPHQFLKSIFSYRL